jgi:hypothetical protein
MVSSRHGKDRATRAVLILLCLLAFGPIMLAALLKIITIETRNGFRQIQRVLAMPSNATPRLPTNEARYPSGETARRTFASLTGTLPPRPA